MFSSQMLAASQAQLTLVFLSCLLVCRPQSAFLFLEFNQAYKTITNSIEQCSLHKLMVTQLVKKPRTFYGARNFITLLARTAPSTGLHSKTQALRDYFLVTFLILLSHVLSSPPVVYSLQFSGLKFWTFHIFSICATWIAYLIPFGFITNKYFMNDDNNGNYIT